MAGVMEPGTEGMGGLLHGSRYSNMRAIQGLLGILRSQDELVKILREHDCYGPTRVGLVIADPNGVIEGKPAKRLLRHLGRLQQAKEALGEFLGGAWAAYWLGEDNTLEQQMAAYRQVWELAGFPSREETDRETGVTSLYLDVPAREAVRHAVKQQVAAEAVAKARVSGKKRLRKRYFAGVKAGEAAWERIKQQAYQRGYDVGSAGGGRRINGTLHLD